MQMWAKYGHALNDPVRNLDFRLQLEFGNVTRFEAKMQHEQNMNVSKQLFFCIKKNLIDNFNLISIDPDKKGRCY